MKNLKTPKSPVKQTLSVLKQANCNKTGKTKMTVQNSFSHKKKQGQNVPVKVLIPAKKTICSNSN
jgi:hypothetical protein